LILSGNEPTLRVAAGTHPSAATWILKKTAERASEAHRSATLVLGRTAQTRDGRGRGDAGNSSSTALVCYSRLVVRFAPWVCQVWLGLVANLGHASAQPHGLYLDYQAPPAACPDRTSFWNEFWARSSKEGEQPAATLRVRINEEAGAFVGRLSIVDSTGGVMDRVMSASSCAEVNLVLALVSSIALHDIPTVAPVTKPIAAPKPASSEIEWSLGATLGIHMAVATGGAPMFGVTAGVRSPHTWASPEARVALLMTSGRTDSVGSNADPLGKAVFNWYGGRVTGCPLQLSVATTTVGPCAVAELGALIGKGVSSMGQITKTGWWLAPGALLHWVWRPLPLQASLAAGVVRPLVRDSFRFRPGPVVFQPPSLGVIAELEVGLSF